jgi:serine protease Do
MKRISAVLIAALLVGRGISTAVAQDSPTNESAVRMLQKVIPTVVCITIEGSGRTSENALLNDLFGGAQGRRTLGGGSGFFISADGFVVTNDHVIRKASDDGISVTTQDGKTYPARLIQTDPVRDLALVKVAAKETFSFIRLDDLSPNLLGQSVFAIGNPHGLGMSVSRGILSARARTLPGKDVADLLQTDAAINPGNSGGPMVDLSGKLVGVSRLIWVGPDQQAQGLFFGVPGNVVRTKIEEFLRLAGNASKPSSSKPVGAIPGF